MARALLQPLCMVFRPYPDSGAGRLIKVSPSKSTGSHLCSFVLNCNRCSFCAGHTMRACPVPAVSSIRCHSSSLTRALTLPTKTPAETSSAHLVKSPRKPVGHDDNTMTIMRTVPNDSRHWVNVVRLAQTITTAHRCRSTLARLRLHRLLETTAAKV